jgi:hypothetical protein
MRQRSDEPRASYCDRKLVLDIGDLMPVAWARPCFLLDAANDSTRSGLTVFGILGRETRATSRL